MVNGLFITSQLFTMNTAAPEGTPSRRVNNREHFGKHGTAPPCLGEALRRGALISATWSGCEIFVHTRFYGEEFFRIPGLPPAGDG